MPVVNQLITMVIVMALGILLRKAGMIANGGIKGLSVVLSKVAVPCMIVNLLQRECTPELLHEFIFVCVATYILSVIFALIFLIVGKFLKLDFPELGLFSASCTYSNVAFMGQPLVLAMFGEEGLIYCVAVIVMQNVFFATLGIGLLTKGIEGSAERTIKDTLKTAFVNGLFISAVIGFILFFNGIMLPKCVKNALQYANDSTVFLSMMVIGALLAKANVKNVLKDYKIYVFSFLNLVVMPILTKLIIVNFTEKNIIIGVMVILMGTPTAAAVPAFADHYDADSRKGAEYVFVSTVLSVITLPLVASLVCC